MALGLLNETDARFPAYVQQRSQRDAERSKHNGPHALDAWYEERETVELRMLGGPMRCQQRRIRPLLKVTGARIGIRRMRVHIHTLLDIA
jgi:hypothetical protein